ncbi:MAG: hypothetical protein ORN51_10275 [Akkermansiaceae bacterium]|jgi:hypothetical protein|nr:hypothetical protein [Akkermansiaceae bacterium]
MPGTTRWLKKRKFLAGQPFCGSKPEYLVGIEFMGNGSGSFATWKTLAEIG